MQPTLSIASRAMLTRSAPMAMATMVRSGRPSWPDPIQTIRSESPASSKTRKTREKPTLKGSATWSAKASGAAPVPPSPPSIVMKSGPLPVSAMWAASSDQNPRCPTADLIPTGRPVSSAMASTKSTRPGTSWNAECELGLMTVRPTGTPRTRAISGVTLAPGSTPPSPGLAPWLSLISTARTGCASTCSMKRSRSKLPSAARQPKYPVPICQTRSPPWRW